jgi:hypothetical protein
MKKNANISIKNENPTNDVRMDNKGIIEKWVYKDNEGQMILIFYENSNKGEWHFNRANFNFNEICSIEYSEKEIIMNSAFQKYEYIIDGNELTAMSIKTFSFDRPEKYIFEKVIEKNVSIYGLWQLENRDGSLWEQLEFDVNHYGTGTVFYYISGVSSSEGLRESPFESKINYTIGQKNVFEILYDGLIIFPDSFPEYFKYFKIQGSEMLVVDGPYRYRRYKKIQ